MIETETAIKKLQEYLNTPSENKKELFVEAKKVSIQVSLFKIPNLMNDKQVICKLPHPLLTEDNQPEVCLIVKDVDKKDRDFEKTVRKYTQLLKKHQLENIVKKVVPLKQLNLEFRPFEAKRALSTSYDIFLADKCLHDILFTGSKLGKEFRKRRKMPIEIDVDSSVNLKQTVLNVLNSTVIRLTGKGPTIDINAFLSTHSVEQAIENINMIKSTLISNLPGGEKNIKSIFIKSTNTPAIQIFANAEANPNEIKLPNNMSNAKKKRAKKLALKRLSKNKVGESKTTKKSKKTGLKKKSIKKIE